MTECPHHGCGEQTKALRGTERVTNRPVWMCEHCGGRLPRPSERERGRKPRPLRNTKRRLREE